MRTAILLGAASAVLPAVSGADILPYWDSTRCIDERVHDLLSRMTLEEKAGQMFHARTSLINDTFDANIKSYVADKHITHYVFSGGVNDARVVAEWQNALQQFSRDEGLGIPITLSSDPQHGWTDDTAVSNVAASFSRWTEPLGIAALRSPELALEFAKIAREEYVSVGIRQALHPTVDIITEPRWGRNAQTMGEDANLTSTLLVEYIKGFQGDKIGPHSVITTTKHFPGGGPMENGEDSHFEWGKNQTYPGNNQEYHLIPFRAAIKAGTRQMMPYYSRPIGTEWEEVAFAFNKGVITDLLKNELGFEGIVVSDWGVVTTRFWGVEDLTELERARKALEAGIDIFGGETKPELIVQLVNSGQIAEERIDYSVRKLMKEKFELGLFDNPFVNVDVAERVVGNEYFSRLGNETQRRAFTLLTNPDDFLPLPQSALNASFYVEGMDPAALEARNLKVVGTPAEADYAFLRLPSPFKPTTASGLAASINNGSIEFNVTEKARQAEIYATIPTVVDIKFNRPPAVPEVAEAAAALMGNYGSSHDAFLDIVFGVDGWAPEGKLPFDMPRSMAAVEASKEDVPFDTEDPLFEFGHGLSYRERSRRTMAHEESLPRPMLAFVSLNVEKPSTIVLLHGGLSCHLEYADVIPLLSEYHLLLPDLPQHSKSFHIPLVSLENVADHVADLISANAHGGKAHIVGLSFGGFAAQVTAIRHPSLVTSLFVTGAEPFQGFRLRASQYPSLIYGFAWSLLGLPDALYWRYAAWMGLRRHDDLLIEMRKNCQLGMLRDEFSTIARYRLEDVGKIETRTLMVAGGRQDDVGASKLAGQVLENRVIRGQRLDDGSRSVVIRDALHAWDLQFPELFARGVLAWVEERPLPEGYEPN
ncbi:hypothetical protein BJF96_g9371 [Verticillium dahliae]|uniref:beta-glucosidase n=1 Tax=Verticillium dahliae TaxID=27337 RepID=A0AA44WAE6_VERDA|nr:hypothetical protein BJF96_g9371 [Verticillium dahliae]